MALVEAALSHSMTFSWDHVPQAETCAQEALTIAREIGDPWVLARSLNQLGMVDTVRGSLEDGDRKYEESVEIGRAHGFRDVTAEGLSMLGAHANWRADFPAAIEVFREAERSAAEAHDGFNELFAGSFAVLPRIALGQYGDALALIGEGLAKARERNNTFIIGRLTNTLGWLHQELGDFRGAVDHDQESAELGRQTKNSNVEISALINLGLDYLNLGEPRRALALLEETQERMEKFAFGAHRWRWSIHLAVYLAEALRATGEADRALLEADRALVQARATGSTKYVARCHALRGEIALGARQWPQAEAELREALRIGQSIGYPTITWQAAHLLARARAGGASIDAAVAAARLAKETIDAVAARAPDAALRRTFLAWPRVERALDDLSSLERGASLRP